MSAAQEAAPIVITFDELREAAALLTTEEAREFDLTPIPKQALAAILEEAFDETEAFGDAPESGLTCPNELRDLGRWLGRCALAENVFDTPLALFAMAASRLADASREDDQDAIDVVRAAAVFLLRDSAGTVALSAADFTQGTPVITVHELRKAAALITTEEAREFDLEPALAAIIEEAFGDAPERGLTYPNELRDLGRWLGQCAFAVMNLFDIPTALFAMAASRLADASREDDQNVIDVVRASAVFLLRESAFTVADTCRDDRQHGEGGV